MLPIDISKPQELEKSSTTNLFGCILLTKTLCFKCVRLMRVAPPTPIMPPQAATTMVPCAGDLTEEPQAGLAGTATVQAIATRQLPADQNNPAYMQGKPYLAMVPWFIEHAVVQCNTGEGAPRPLPPFEGELAAQQEMSAAGISVPLHGVALLSHGNALLYNKWQYTSGIMLTQAWARRLVHQAMVDLHKTTVHPDHPVGIIVTSRCAMTLSKLSRREAAFVQRHESDLQKQLTALHKAACERGFVHLECDTPSNIGIHVMPDGKPRVYLLDWGYAAHRVRMKDNHLMQYLLGMTDKVVSESLRIAAATRRM
jgi:hypothetical protein